MPAIDDVSRDQNELLARLRSLLGHAATDVGTPFPDALAAVLKVDRRLSGSDDGLKRHRALSDAEIYNLAEKLNFALANDTEVELPLGSIMKGTRKGAVAGIKRTGQWLIYLLYCSTTFHCTNSHR